MAYIIKNKLRVYYDAKITRMNRDASLISIGMISSTGAHFYAEFTDIGKKGLDQNTYMNGIKYLLLADTLGNHNNRTNGIIKRYKHGKDGSFNIIMAYVRHAVQEELIAWLENELAVTKYKQIQICAESYTYTWMLLLDLITRPTQSTTIELPKYIHDTPLDLITLLFNIKEDPWLHRESFSGPLSFPNPSLEKGKTEFILKQSSLWSATVLKGCFEKAENKLFFMKRPTKRRKLTTKEGDK